MDLSKLLDAKSTTQREIDPQRNRELQRKRVLQENRELAKLFGAHPLLTDANERYVALGLPFMVPDIIARLMIRRQRPLSYFHDKLVSRNLVGPEDTSETQAFLDQLCRIDLHIPDESYYRFTKHESAGADEPYYSMRWHSDRIVIDPFDY